MKRSRRLFSAVEQLETRALLAAISWDGGGDGTHWLDPVNWSTNTLPSSTDNVTIDVPGSITVSLDSSPNAAVASLTLRETLRLNTSTLTVGTLNVGGTVDLGTTSVLATTGAAFFTLTPSAKLKLDMASGTVYGRLVVGTTLFLDDASSLSTLEVVPLAGFDPASYVSMQPVTAQSIVGSFDDFVGATTTSGKPLRLTVKPEETSFFDAAGFEDSNYVVNNDLSTTSPWTRSGAATITGNVTSFAHDGVKGVTMNRPATVAAFSALREYPNITPAAAPSGRTKLWISWDQYIAAPLSVTNLGPFMGMEAYGSTVLPPGYTRLGAAGVDAKTGEVLWLNGSFQTAPGAFASFDEWHHFDLVLNYSNNTYAVALDGNVIPQASAVPFQSLTSNGFSDADITAVQAQPEPPIEEGTAHFDNYNVGWRSIAAGATPRVALNLRAAVGAVAAPTLTPSFDFELQQALNVQFNQDVSSSIAKEDFKVFKLPSMTPVSTAAASFSYNVATKTATLNFQSQLPDGNYRLVLNAGAVESSTGAPSAATQLDFFVLGGDANRDRHVNFDDLLIVAQNYGKLNQTFSQGNFDYDPNGEVDFDDLLIVAQHYDAFLPALQAGVVLTTSAKTRRHSMNDLLA